MKAFVFTTIVLTIIVKLNGETTPTGFIKIANFGTTFGTRKTYYLSDALVRTNKFEHLEYLKSIISDHWK